MKNRENLFIVILFYFGWFGSVFLAQTNFSVITFLFPLLLILFLIARKNITRKNFIFAITTSSIGIFFDFILIEQGFVTVFGDPIFIIPVWLISIWILFAFSIIKLGPNLNLPIWLSVVLGMIMGPLSYKSGEAFEVLKFSSSTTFIIYSCFWGVSFPLILNLSKRYL